jgi:hypothetical protein
MASSVDAIETGALRHGGGNIEGHAVLVRSFSGPVRPVRAQNSVLANARADEISGSPTRGPFCCLAR